MRVALLKGQSQYGVLRAFVDEVAEAFASRGWEAEVFDFAGCAAPLETEIPRRLLAAGKPDLIFSVNSYGEYADEAGRSLTDLTGAPHVVQYVDYPLHTLDRFTTISRHAAVLLVDRSHIRTVEELFGPDRFAYLGFGPHGGLGSPCAPPDSAEAFLRERPIALLFAGTNYAPTDELLDGLPEFVKQVFEAAIEIALSAEWISPLDALDQAFAQNGLDPREPGRSAEELASLRHIRLLASLVQESVRRERRQRFLFAAACAGLPLTTVGHGWDTTAGLYPRIDNRGPADVHECLDLMRQSRLCLNLSGNFGEGSHERVLSAMLAGAAAVSDHTAFYAEAFSEGQEIVLFRWTSLEDDLARLADLVRRPAEVFEIARAGHVAAASGHRWSHRVDGIIEAAARAVQKLGLASKLAA